MIDFVWVKTIVSRSRFFGLAVQSSYIKENKQLTSRMPKQFPCLFTCQFSLGVKNCRVAAILVCAPSIRIGLCTSKTFLCNSMLFVLCRHEKTHEGQQSIFEYTNKLLHMTYVCAGAHFRCCPYGVA